MLKKRMILCLLMNSDGLFFNSRQFSLQPVGELDWIRRYLDFEAIDELVLLNVDRDTKSIHRFADQMKSLARYCFVPITAGGGVRSVEHFDVLLDSGADKVAINSHAYESPSFVTEAAGVFGSQCVVISIDCRSTTSGYRTYRTNGTVETGCDAVEWARRVEELGAGEIFLTSIDRDGVATGYDLALVNAVSRAVTVPVIASGGVGEFHHLVEGIVEGGAAAVSAANIFHYIGNGLINAKKYIADQGLDFPLWNFV